MNADGLMGLLFDTMAQQGMQLLPEDDQALLERVLQRGSGREGGKVRIYVAVKKWGTDLKRLKQFVSDEYDVSGHSFDNHSFVDYDRKGISVSFWHGERETVRFTWDRAVKTLVEMQKQSRLYDVKTMQDVYAIWQRMASQGKGYPDPYPRMEYPQEV